MLSATSARRAEKIGYTNVKVLFGGLPAWKKAQLPVFSSAEALQRVLVEKGGVITIDLRNESQQLLSHIPGAVSIGAKGLASEIPQLPGDKNAPVVLYGSDSKDGLDLFSLIREAGYINTTVLDGGFKRWTELGFPLDSGEVSKKVVYVSKPKEGIVTKESFLSVASGKNLNTLLLDVRSDEELGGKDVSGTLHVPADEVIDRLVEIPIGKDIYIYCKSGVRAEMIYILLKQKGYNVKYLDMRVGIKDDGSFELQYKG